MKNLNQRFFLSIAALLVTFPMGCDQSPSPQNIEANPSEDGISINQRLGVPRGDFQFEPPVRIFAGGIPVSVSDPGYACPTMADLDGDGVEDLVVGQFSGGKMQFYRNESETGRTPKFADGQWLKSGDTAAMVPGVW